MATTHLVIGATGGIGRAVVKHLLEKGESVRALVRDTQKAQRYFTGLGTVEIIRGDAAHLADVATAVNGCSHLFYCLNLRYDQWKTAAERHLAVSIEAAARSGAKLVFPGNVYLYGHAQSPLVNELHPWAPHTEKGAIRASMERMIQKAGEESGVRTTVVRMPDFYGPFVVNGFSEKLYLDALRGKRMQWIGSLDADYEAIFIDDAGKAMVTAGLDPRSDGTSYNVPGAGVVTARKFLTMIAYGAGTRAKPTLMPDWLIAIGGLFNPVVKEVREMLYLKKERLILDGSRYAATFGEIPVTPYEKGIALTLEWAKGWDSKK